MYQHQHKRKKRDYFEVPSMDNLVEVQEWLEDLFETVVETLDKQLLALYNKTAHAYNVKAGKIIFSNFQNPSQMATTKKAAAQKETVAAPAPKTAATKKVAAATVAATEATEPEAKPLSQKEQVIQAATEGKSVNEIVEEFGFIKTNVSWYFSQHKLHSLPAQVERKRVQLYLKEQAKADIAAEKAQAKADIAAAKPAVTVPATEAPKPTGKKAK